MKLSLKLRILVIVLIAGVLVPSSKAWAADHRQVPLEPKVMLAQVDVETFSYLASDDRSTPCEFVTLAQAFAPDDAARKSHQQILRSMLERDDIAAAKAFVDAAAKAGDLSPTDLHSMNDAIWRTKTERILQYSKKVRDAIAKSDFRAIKDYSERIQQLAAPVSASDGACNDDIAIHGLRSDAGIALSASDEAPMSVEGTTEADSLALVAKNDAIVDQMHRALKENRLFPPAEDSVFELAASRLSMTPGDLAVHRILDDVLARQQAQVSAYLRDARPDLATGLVNRLLQSLEEFGANAAWLTGFRFEALDWISAIQPELVSGLVASTETTIEKRWLTIAPEGEGSARAYLELLTAQLGRDHVEVTRLANEIIVSYRDLIDEHLARQEYDGALRVHARMEAIALQFGAPLDDIAALPSKIEAMGAKQQEHDQLLLLAAHWRDKGQLIEPAGANALEFAARAIKLAANPKAASKAFIGLIMEQRLRIERLIIAGHLREAGDALERLAAAIDQPDINQAAIAATFYTEAEQIFHRADLEDGRRRQWIRDAVSKNPAPPAETLKDRKLPLIFVNPF